MSAAAKRAPGRRVAWERVECVTCEGCGFLANDAEATPWHRVRVLYPDLILRRPHRRVLEPLVCSYCSGLGWCAVPLDTLELPK